VYDPATYIDRWYKHPTWKEGEDNTFYAWMKAAFDLVPECEWGMEVGCGPVIVLSAFASRKVHNIIMTEYNTDCFKFI
jgi:hypothetical protein